MALERFWWGPSLYLLRDSRNGALWLEHCESEVCLFVLYCIHTVIYSLKSYAVNFQMHMSSS